MKILPLLLVIASASLAHAEKPSTTTGQQKPDRFIKEGGFCICYQIRDADKREERFIPAETAQNDPFHDSSDTDARHIPYNIIVSRHHLDFASLLSRTVKQKKLSNEQLRRFKTAAFEPKQTYPLMACHDPHHVFIFYDVTGVPVTCLEVCFSCHTIRIADRLLKPIPETDNKSDDPFGEDRQPDIHPPIFAGDILAIAGISEELGLGVGKFKNVEEFKKTRKPNSKR